MINAVKVTCVIFVLFVSNLNAQLSLGDDNNSSNAMMALQQISVTIGGEFIVNGTFPASSTERVDQFITRIYNTSKATLLSSIRDEKALLDYQKKYEKFALRNIGLIHNNGRKETIDLAVFRLSGDFSNNPYLKEGDLIVFPPLDLETNFISITGAVNKPLVFQYVEGDDLQTALYFARGVNTSYKDVDKVRISRLTNNGTKENILVEALDSNIKLESGDRITVLYKERNNYNYRVLVLGEINQPGYVSISKNSTTLKDVINKVGGFTDKASLKFAELIRDNNSFTALRKSSLESAGIENISLDKKIDPMAIYRELEFLKMFRVANLEMRDTLYFGIDNKLRTLNGFSQLDFRNLDNDSSFESTYQVNDGDIIIVPEEKNEVYVWGGVKEMGYYPYKENQTVLQYINDAGGYSEIAYGEDEVYLIKGKSRDWINSDDYPNTTVEPGDYIYVKKERPTQEFWFYLSRIGAVAGILGGLATIYLAFK